jgi:shikimate dehydrogenase
MKLLLGLIGAGIQRSLSPALQEDEARHHGLRLHYQLIDLKVAGAGVEALPALMSAVRVMRFDGLNITYPCKQAVPLLDALSDEARAIGAVNTVVREGSRLVGHNTDCSGWRWGFQRALPRADLSRVVLLGAGGAGAAVAHAALGLGVRELRIFDTDASRAAALASSLQARFPDRKPIQVNDLEAAVQSAHGLIHCTPVGMAGHPDLPLPAGWLRRDLWVSDIVYVPLETPLLKAARQAGCTTMDGGHMNVGWRLAACRSWARRRWRGWTPTSARSFPDRRSGCGRYNRPHAMKFYLVDDDPDVLTILTKVLEAAGHRVEASPSSLQALKQIPVTRPDCVLTDLMMPDMDGFELVRELRRRPELADMKIIVISGKSYDFDRRRAKELGATATSPLSSPDAARVHRLGHVEPVVVEYWGVHGTPPVPGPAYTRYGGNTLRERRGWRRAAVDLRLRLASLSDRIMKGGAQRFSGRIFISHTHWDHINTIPFFAPLYARGNQIEIFGPYQGELTIEKAISAQMDSVYFPVTVREFGARVVYRDLREEALHFGPVRI